MVFTLKTTYSHWAGGRREKITEKRMGSRVWTFRFLTSSSFPASKVRSKRRKYSLQSAPPLTKRSAWHNATSVVGWLWMQVQQNPPMPVCWSDSLTLNWWILTVAMAQTPWPVTLMYKASIVRPTVPKWLWTTSQVGPRFLTILWTISSNFAFSRQNPVNSGIATIPTTKCYW